MKKLFYSSYFLIKQYNLLGRGLTLTANEFTKQHHSVQMVEDNIVEVDGGLAYVSDGGGDFVLMEAFRS